MYFLMKKISKVIIIVLLPALIWSLWKYYVQNIFGSALCVLAILIILVYQIALALLVHFTKRQTAVTWMITMYAILCAVLCYVTHQIDQNQGKLTILAARDIFAIMRQHYFIQSFSVMGFVRLKMSFPIFTACSLVGLMLAKKPCDERFTVDVIGIWGSFMAFVFVMAYMMQLILAITFLYYEEW
jgi:hypothetical protein